MNENKIWISYVMGKTFSAKKNNVFCLWIANKNKTKQSKQKFPSLNNIIENVYRWWIMWLKHAKTY